MIALYYALSAEGTTDNMLLPVLDWLLRLALPETPLVSNFSTGGRTVSERIRRTLADYRCDLLFVHRDANGEGLAARRSEILAARDALAGQGNVPLVCVVPARTSEAWLLTVQRWSR